MKLHRRDFGKLALAAAAMPEGVLSAKPDSRINGVQIGAITYSYRAEPRVTEARELLRMVVDSGISTIELMPPAAEIFAGAPAAAGGRGGGRGEAPTPEQEAAAAALKKWRLSASMDKFKEFRRMYNDAGVTIYCHKLFPTPAMSDDEYDYMFNVAAALGASQVSLELPTDVAYAKRLGDFALKHGMVAAYHAHEQATESAWDAVLDCSKGNAVNLDCGHYVAGFGRSPIPAIVKYHDRLASLHLKDRTPTTTAARGLNLPWGEGLTPIYEILQLMKKNKYPFVATIELEYRIPEGSNSVEEVKKCLEYCRKALA